MKVNKQVLVSFSISKYCDEVLCDIVQWKLVICCNIPFWQNIIRMIIDITNSMNFLYILELFGD